MRLRYSPLLFIAAALASAASAKTQVFLETNEDQFAQGHAEGVVWTNLGTLRLGRSLEPLLGQTEGVDYVARCAEAPDGSVYAVTGGTGRVYRFKDGKVALFATLEDKFLFSVLADKNGDLYVGSGGSKGRIWRIEPQAKGEPKTSVVFEDNQVKYVWDLAWMKDGAIAAATGDQGKLLRIAPNGKSEVLVDSEANHVLCLAAAPDGTLYAGTDGEALVYRWADKKAFILYDADEAEVTCLALDAAGNLYVGTSGGAAGRQGGVEIPPPSPAQPAATTPAGGATAPAAEAPRESAPPPSGENQDKTPQPAPVSAAVAAATKVAETVQAGKPVGRPTPAKGGAAVYRITPEGLVARIFEPKDAMVLALAVTDGRILVGTGRNARIYELGSMTEDEEACLASIDPKQVMTLLVTRSGQAIVGSAGPGRLYALAKGYTREGTYTSQVYDAGGSAQWGTLEWRGRVPDGAEIAIATRTGNVRDPDKGLWSDWSKAITKPPARIESPAGRFIQFRVTMRSKADGHTPVLEQFEAAYLRSNDPPKVLSIGEALAQDPAARAQAVERFRQAVRSRTRPTPGQQTQPPQPQPPPPEGAQPVRLLQWQAQDPNNDTLRYDVYFRSQGEAGWILLEEDLPRPECPWDTSTVADGWYEIKVVASDRADWPPDAAREDFKISDPILVDNTAPVIEKVESQVRPGGEVEVRFAARDSTSRLASAGWTVDSAMGWRTLAPLDGLFDGRQKEFRLTIPKLSPGPHRVALRVADEAQNVGHAAITVNVPAK